MFPIDLIARGSESHRVGAATETALVPMFVSRLGKKVDQNLMIEAVWGFLQE